MNQELGEEEEAEIGPESSPSIVVGHDRSSGANVALDLALQLASELKAPVTIVRAWSFTTAPRPANWKFGYVSSVDELAEAVQAELVSDTQSRVARFPLVVVTCRAYHASPTKALIRASRNSRMLVVGSRGLGGISEMVLGSVSDQCVRHAQCPVLVARRPKD
jgi:nucleotide-binding universal stress UspA family protein